MSQAAVPSEMNNAAESERGSTSTLPEESSSGGRAVLPDGEFDYKPVPLLAPVSFFFAMTSGLALYTEIALPLCVFAFVLAWFARRTIKRAEGELGGGRLTGVALVASLLFFIGGIGTFAYAYSTEVPPGYLRVNFPRDISAKQFVYRNGVRELHPDVAPLDGKKIYIKGWMYNTRSQVGLDHFILLKDNGKCCFGGNPKPYDMIEVRMKPGLRVDRLDGMVAVAGVLHCRPQAAGAVYRMEATLVEPARTRY